jgi:PAS domain S-box-containing protein
MKELSHSLDRVREYRENFSSSVGQKEFLAGASPVQVTAPVVLVVDDSPTVLLQMRKSLEQAGFTVEEAADGAETLARFPQLQPDIVLLDVMMPGIDGFETCARLRRLPGGDRTPIIMITSLDDLHSINRAYEVGATDFVTKPINAVILNHRLRYMLRGHRALQKLYHNEVVLQQAHLELERRVLDRTAALEHAAVQLQQEVRERQRAEEELRDAHTHLRFLVENSPLAVIEWDARFRVQRWSLQAERVFGWAAREVLGRHFHEWRFIPHEDADIVSQAVTLLYESDKLQGVTRNRNYRKDGAVIECEWYNSVLRDGAGSVESVLSLVQDVTARQEAERLKDELVSTVSHELRTPLTSLRGFAELMLRRDFAPSKQREFLSIIHKESIRLTNLINDFLDIQRMESGRQVYHFEALELPGFLRETLALFLTEGGRHRFHLALPARLPLVSADQDCLRQVLTNLLSNAVKFSPKGGLITLGATVEENQIVVSVADQGMGIPKEALPQLFSKFFRVDNQETRSIGGTGLGLALIKKTIEAHGGKVGVTSEEGVGSTFFFTLPRVNHSSEEHSSQDQQPKKQRQKRQERKHEGNEPVALSKTA